MYVCNVDRALLAGPCSIPVSARAPDVVWNCDPDCPGRVVRALSSAPFSYAVLPSLAAFSHILFQSNILLPQSSCSLLKLPSCSQWCHHNAGTAVVLLWSFPLSSCPASSCSVCLLLPPTRNPSPPYGPSPLLVNICLGAQRLELSYCAHQCL